MEGHVIHKFIDKVKDKFTKSSKGCPSVTDYAFSLEEIADLNRQNKQKIQDLKQDVFSSKKKVKEELDEEKSMSKEEKRNLLEGRGKNASSHSEFNILDEGANSLNQDCTREESQESSKREVRDVILEGNDISKSVALDKNTEVENEFDNQNFTKESEETDMTEELAKKQMNSYIYLSDENQKLIMNQWEQIDINVIDQDIMRGKDILNHNYTITFADDAARFIHDMRKKYEVVLCYLIGFNNEKKSIYDKVIFSDKMDDEWKFLKQYIKILEKIRNFKK